MNIDQNQTSNIDRDQEPLHCVHFHHVCGTRQVYLHRILRLSIIRIECGQCNSQSRKMGLYDEQREK